MRALALLALSMITVVCTGGCGCVFFGCHPATLICPDGAVVGESVEAILTVVVGDDISIEWSVAGEVELVDEKSESAVIRPTGPGVITVTVTATDERTGDSATASCAFNAVEESDPGSRGFSPREAS